ncbi:hypothetical protein VTO42DRAFT_2474 [Malbranchea cinnamomea]
MLPLDIAAAAARRCFEVFLAPCLSTLFNMIALPSTTTTAQHPPHLHHALAVEPPAPASPTPTAATTTTTTTTAAALSGVSDQCSTAAHLSSVAVDTTASPPAVKNDFSSVNRMLAVANPPATVAPSMSSSSVSSAVHPHSSTRASGRPKLSLQTSCLPVTFGNSTTALSFGPLSAGCTASPTVRNTFTNAYDTFRGSLPPSATSSPSSKYPPNSLRGESTSSSNANGKNSSGADVVPYQLPLGVRSILRNSPLPFQRASVSAPPSNGRKRLFPAKKRVNYRYPIEEEITTVRFVARHSDLLSSDDSDSDEDFSDAVSPSGSSSEGEGESNASESTSPSESSPVNGDLVAPNDHKTRKSLVNDAETAQTPTPRRRKRKYQRSERQVLAAGIRDGLIDSTTDCETPRTPVQRRSKRARQWRWTLGPIKDGYVQEMSPLSSSSSSSSCSTGEPFGLPPTTSAVNLGYGPLSPATDAAEVNVTRTAIMPCPREAQDAPLPGSSQSSRRASPNRTVEVSGT